MAFADLDSALVSIGKRLEKDHNDWEAWASKADLLCSAGLHEIAVRCCDRTLELNPDNAFAWNTKGKALNILGRHEEATDCYNKAKELEPKFWQAGRMI